MVIDFPIDPTLYSLILHLLDYFGTMAFAVTGAFKAIEKKTDFVGVIFLSIITGLAGGIIRDTIFGKTPPIAFLDPLYVIVAIGAGTAIFILYPKIKRHWNIFLRFDAIGLGVFTIIGATTAYHLFGLNFLIISFGGLISAIGGGVIRDMIVNEIPLVFIRELYATASFGGIVIFYLLLFITNPIIASIFGISFAISIRLITMRYGLNLPKVKT